MLINVDAKSWHGKSIRSRFEEKIQKETCWIWKAGKRGNNGYGGFRINATSIRLAHNVSYELYVGEIPKGMKVLHKCDNPLCVKPSHLFLGTQQENIKDRDVKGRQRNRFSVKQLGKASDLKGGQ
jgi:hypothetical protein